MTKKTVDLLLEIGTEELPPASLQDLSDHLAQGMIQGLKKFSIESGNIQTYATPRRIAVLIHDVQTRQKQQQLEKKGPTWAAAFDQDNKPTKALNGFLKANGLSMDQIERLETEKGIWVIARTKQPGKPTINLLPEIAQTALNDLPIGKGMRWGIGNYTFVRPVHWIVYLLGSEVVNTTLLGIQTGRMTHGHRSHHPAPLCIDNADEYSSRLENEGKILADFVERRTAIKVQVESLAATLGGRAMLNESLLDEITAMVEWPIAIHGEFDPKFLEIPSEVLITTMMNHQRYFPITDEKGNLLPLFITIANIDSRNPSIVRQGNEKVLRPRLQDAEFFWQQDTRRTLESYRNQLKNVLFQKRLGSLYEKTERLAVLTSLFSEQLGLDAKQGGRAGQLSKCDLVTSMVFEFPHLQGIMGKYYALTSQEPKSIAIAMQEQYLPTHAGGDLPSTPLGQSLSLADKLDTLVGIFAIGRRPSGTKDPFALRRAALGIVRILIEKNLPFDLQEMLERTATILEKKVHEVHAVVPDVFDYIMERLSAYYGEVEIPTDVIESVLAVRPTRLNDIDQRIKAVHRFRSTSEAETIASANKRIRNILKQENDTSTLCINERLLTEPSEQRLHHMMKEIGLEMQSSLQDKNYAQALNLLSKLKVPVDEFFNETMVMVEDLEIRKNRLALLIGLQQLFLEIADFSRLQP